MREVVLDASVVLQWFRDEGERHVAAARVLRDAYARGDLLVLAPQLLALEFLNVAGRRWGWDAHRLVGLAVSIAEIGFEIREPDLESVARWTGGGLTAYDACYVALAESEAISLVTDDELILATAPDITIALGAAAEGN